MPARTTVRLPADLLDRAKRKAAAEGRTLTALIEDGLRIVVAEQRKAAKAKRSLPPVSKATGGLMPGIDLTRFSAIQEMDAIEYAQRMKRFRRECPRICFSRGHAATSHLPALARRNRFR